MPETFEAFSARIRAAAGSIPIIRGGQSTTLDKLSEADRRAHIDRWHLEGVDPTAGLATSATADSSKAPPRPRAEMNRYPVQAGEDPELFYGWVQRALIPGPGYEWAMIEIPRHIVEGLAKSDSAGRKIRRDTREVMTAEIVGGLADWNLGNHVRGGNRCKHKFFFNPQPVLEKRTGRVLAPGRSECVHCGTPEAT